MNFDKTRAAKRLMLESCFKTFTRWNFKQSTKQKFSFSHHHAILAEAFQKVLDGIIKRLKIEIPPRYSKTEFVKQFCAAGFARNAESNFIYTSYSDALALKCSKEIKDAIQHEKFLDLWPIKIKQDTKAKKLWETTAGGGMYATSFGGPITGFGAGKLDSYKSKTQWEFNGALIIDDPLKAQDRHRQVARDEIKDYFDSTLPSRFNSTDTPCILIMQRLHPDDLAGHIEETEGEDWTTIKLPAINLDGTPLWPEKHSIEDLDRLARNNEMFSAQYMQEPILLGGNMIKTEMFKTYIELPYLKRRFITVDTAQKEKEHNDYSVFQCWGVGHDNYIYMIDQHREKMEYGKLKTRFIAFWNKHLKMFDERQYGYLTCAYVEDKSSGTQLIQESKAQGKIPIAEIQRNRSKLERVVDILLPRLASGFIYVPAEAPWLHDFFSECQEFNSDMSHKHDDQIDPMVDAVEIAANELNIDSEGIINNNISRKRKTKKKKVRRR